MAWLQLVFCRIGNLCSGCAYIVVLQGLFYFSKLIVLSNHSQSQLNSMNTFGSEFYLTSYLFIYREKGLDTRR
jgi:hypothetical protein